MKNEPNVSTASNDEQGTMASHAAAAAGKSFQLVAGTPGRHEVSNSARGPIAQCRVIG